MRSEPSSVTIPGIIRKMSRCERIFCMSPACTVMMAARIGGNIDEDLFRQALITVSRIHPLLRAKVVFDENHESWFSSDAVPSIPLRVITRRSQVQWIEELTSEVQVPFDLIKGPLIKFVLLNSDDCSDLLVLCNHSICDGMALAILIKEILYYYGKSEEQIQERFPPVSQDLLILKRSVKGIIGGLFAGYVNWKWRNNEFFFNSEDYSALYKAYWENRKPGMAIMEFNLDESDRLRETCRKHQVTIGSAVSAAFLRAHQDITGGFSPKQQNIMVPYDIRRRSNLPDPDVFCFCVGSVRIPARYSLNKSFWENTQDLHATIHTHLKTPDPSGLEVSSIDYSLLDALSAFAPFSELIPDAFSHTKTLHRFIQDTNNIARVMNRKFSHMIPGFVSSNLGKVELLTSDNSLSLDRLIFLPSASEINPLIMGGAGTSKGMTFTLVYVDPPAKTGISPESDMIRIRNRALELLGFPENVSNKATIEDHTLKNSVTEAV